MKVLTLKQPFAALVSEGIKEYEFRTWKTNYRGEILIHAGLEIDKNAVEKYKDYNLDYKKGCSICKATLVDCILVDDKLKELLKEKNNYVYNNAIKNKEKKLYAFVLKDVKKIEPINIKGKLSFWEYDYKDDGISGRINN